MTNCQITSNGLLYYNFKVFLYLTGGFKLLWDCPVNGQNFVGCRALEKTGVKSRIFADGMTRGPVVRFRSITGASEAAVWLKNAENFSTVKENFDSTSRFARLSRVNVHMAGRYLFLRFVAETGDAMGMNMVSKGTTTLKTLRVSVNFGFQERKKRYYSFRRISTKWRLSA